MVLDGLDLGKLSLRFDTIILRKPHRLRRRLAQPSDLVVVGLDYVARGTHRLRRGGEGRRGERGVGEGAGVLTDL